MPFGTGRLCGCNNDFCMKTALCDYNPLLNPYDSSSGIDKNPFEMKENYTNMYINTQNDYNIDKKNYKKNYKKKHNNKHYIKLIILIFILIIIYYYYYFY